MDNETIIYNGTETDGSIKISVEKIRVEGRGVIILTGPSSCGKGEVAKALCNLLDIPKRMHLSMGDILRDTIENARKDNHFRLKLQQNYGIGSNLSVFDPDHNRMEIIKKAENHKNEICACLKIENDFVSQLDWLEFCVCRGLLIPDEWTEKIIDAAFSETEELQSGIVILDGYPRTTKAAESLLKTLGKLGIPVIKVLHLSITKNQMKLRALNRKREDDTEDSLERRYQFYIDKVQPCIDYLKSKLGASKVTLIDAHQPVTDDNGNLELEKSIRKVVLAVIKALGFPKYMNDMINDKSQF